MAKTTILLDTSVLIYNPDVFSEFKEAKKAGVIAVSSATIQELDGIKKDPGEKGRNAREAIRIILNIVANDYVIDKGRKLEIIDITSADRSAIIKTFGEYSNDNAIVYSITKCKTPVLLLTVDNVMLIKAKTFLSHSNIKDSKAKLFDTTKIRNKNNGHYNGRGIIYTNSDGINNFYSNNYVTPDFFFDEEGAPFDLEGIFVNEFIELINAENPQNTALGIWDGKSVRKLPFVDPHPYGVTPKNAGQLFLINALMLDVEKAPLVICKGPAGTAKTFLALAVALDKMLNTPRGKKEYDEILCCRPNVQMDEDIGFLPGDEKEKIQPYFRPIFDNIKVLTRLNKKNEEKKGDKHSTSNLDVIDFANINFEAVAFMRGRSVVDTFIIVDEAQNLTITQVKGLITRTGEGTKIVLIGDPEQIDHPYLDYHNNGLSYAADKFKGNKICYQLTLEDKEGVRSKLATEAAKVL